MSGQVDRQHGVPMPGEPARRQLPHAVIAASAVQEDDRGLAPVEGPAARCRKHPLAVDLQLHGEVLPTIHNQSAMALLPLGRRCPKGG